MDKSYSRVERGMRLDEPDVRNIAEISHRDALAQLLDVVLMGVDGRPTILWGFGVTIASPVVTVARGAAITGFRDRGVLYRGMVVAGGPGLRTFNASTNPNGTYGIYVRLAMRPSMVRSRRFWNPTSIPPAENTRILPTRVVEDWDLTLERASPGEEWLLLGTVIVTAGALSGFVLSTSKLFDSLGPNRNYTDADWGGGLDRDETDGVNGLRGLTRWAKMVNRQLQDAIGATFFGSNPQSGTSSGGNGPRSLQQLNAEKAAINGGLDYTGVPRPNADQTVDIGTTSRRWRTAYVQGLNFMQSLISAGTGYANLILSGAELLTANRMRLDNTPNGGVGGNTSLVQLRAGLGAEGRVELLGQEVALTPGQRVIVQDRRVQFASASSGTNGANPASSIALTNELSAKHFAKAWVDVESNAGFTIRDGLNVASVAWQAGTNSLRINFAANMANRFYAVGHSWSHNGAGQPLRLIEVLGKNVAYVDIQMYDAAGGPPPPVINMLTDTGGELSIQIFATQ